jgi:hypothetical protein
MATAISGLPWEVQRLVHQLPMASGWVKTWMSVLTTTTALRPRYKTTRTTATPMASRKPRRNTAASRASRKRVTGTFWP